MKKVLAASCFVLTYFVFSFVADAASFSKYEYKTAYGDFVKRITGDLRRAGFALDTGISKEITDGNGQGVSVEIRIKKYPDSLKKYFGEPVPQGFTLQLLELDSTVVFSVKTIKDGKPAERLSFFKHIDKKDFYYFDIGELVREAKAELILALYGLDCRSRYGGFARKNEGENSLFLRVRNFPYDVDEFITLFFRELKYYGLRYTVTERFPFMEMRVFGFPVELSLLLPEPNSVFFLLENKQFDRTEKVFISRTDRYYGNQNSMVIVTFDGRESLGKKAAEAAKNIFISLYAPSCPQYYDMM
ncbi:MAG: hypothetical protein UV01_C0006G0034 [Parcubacteria group bacterium GW2011_GWA2_42_14]|nr:MAG: hypothetical protein UV01_C0006G0034 [Parcubacteria group bacterium GW2011_GWA2_42_14]OGZ97409.1 MAG: hypothetical protein A3D41_05580 [Candidatus Sungbacteria bacterium RIFCSPHIGHO2_02_FULL_41_12b]